MVKLEGTQLVSLITVILSIFALCLALSTTWYDNDISMWDMFGETCARYRYNFDGYDYTFQFNENCVTIQRIRNLFLSALTCEISAVAMFFFQACASDAALTMRNWRRALRLIPVFLFIIAALLVSLGIAVWENNFVDAYTTRYFGFYIGCSSAFLMFLSGIFVHLYPLFDRERLAKAEASVPPPPQPNVVYIASQTPMQPMVYHQQPPPGPPPPQQKIIV